MTKITKINSQKYFKKKMLLTLQKLLFLPTFFLHYTDDILSQTEKQRYDGWFNNLAHPEWGSIGKFKCIKQAIKSDLLITI